MKLHLGCGCVYLFDYVNVDANPYVLANEVGADKYIKENGTTLDKYYTTDFNNRPSMVVADVKAVIENLPFDNGTVDEVVMFHVLEHVPYYRQATVLSEINRVLKIGGIFKVAVPDTIGTAKLLAQAKIYDEEDWAIRLLYGTQRNEYSHHFIGFTNRTLRDTLSKYGFGEFKNTQNINFYPAIHLETIKKWGS
jgi:predicted SAM-dependent methyltransferase